MKTIKASGMLRVGVAAFAFGLGSLTATAQPNYTASSGPSEDEGADAVLFETVNVSGADFDGDGIEETVTGHGPGEIPPTYLGLMPELSSGFVGAWQFDQSPAGIALRVTRVFRGGGLSDAFGASVSTTGDFDGDGTCDVAIGAPGTNDNTGVVYVFSGRTAELLRTVQGEHPGDRFGAAVSLVGDALGIGRSTLIVGAPGNDSGAPDAGKVYVIDPQGAVRWTYTGEMPGQQFGMMVSGSTLTDLPGQPALWTLSIGAQNVDPSLPGARRVYSYSGPIVAAEQPVSILDLWQAVLRLAIAIEYLGTANPAGDVNADGAVTDIDIAIALADVRVATLRDAQQGFQVMFPICLPPHANSCMERYCDLLRDAYNAYQVELREVVRLYDRASRAHARRRARSFQQLRVEIVRAFNSRGDCIVDGAVAGAVPIVIGGVVGMALGGPPGTAVGATVVGGAVVI